MDPGPRAGANVLVLPVLFVLVVVGTACSVDGVAATQTTSTRALATSGSTSTSTTAPSTTTTAPPPPPITMAFSGDLLTHLPVDRSAAELGAASGRAYDFGPLLSAMTPVIGAADIAVCHLEVPLAPTPGDITGWPRFGAPAEVLDATKATGYDGCSTASNHSLDKGLDGIRTTLDRFDALGLRHAGTARSEEEAGVITTYDVRGVHIAHLSYSFGFNGLPLPTGAPWAANLIDPARVRADAARARAGGAHLVVVSLHWGTEYRSAPDGFQESVAGALLPSGDIDLVIGHHAHVVQPIGKIGPTYVVFGLGNELSNQAEDPKRDGLTVVASARPAFGRLRFTSIEIVPTWVDLPSHRVLPVVRTLADPTTPPALADALRRSYARTVATARSEGAPGLTVAARP
jgi:poly-gamma-glutamate synthesis protein (capsule biosynthesis protein)